MSADGFDDRRLGNLISRFIDKRKNDEIVDPSWIANEALVDLDPEGIVRGKFPIIYIAAHAAFSQIARSLLRRKRASTPGMSPSWSRQDEIISRKEQPPLPGFELLQDRYPRAHVNNVSRGYVLRESLSQDDWLWNLLQFAKDITGRQAHADQFRRWGLARGFRDGGAADQSA